MDNKELIDIKNWLLAEIQSMREENDESQLETYNTLHWVYEKIITGKYRERMRVIEIDHLLAQGKKYMESGDVKVFTRI